jgi:hypothetical protein
MHKSLLGCVRDTELQTKACQKPIASSHTNSPARCVAHNGGHSTHGGHVTCYHQPSLGLDSQCRTSSSLSGPGSPSFLRVALHAAASRPGASPHSARSCFKRARGVRLCRLCWRPKRMSRHVSFCICVAMASTVSGPGSYATVPPDGAWYSLYPSTPSSRGGCSRRSWKQDKHRQHRTNQHTTYLVSMPTHAVIACQSQMQTSRAEAVIHSSCYACHKQSTSR